jgi:threonine/homoserine/homoserine lactone efflux protein
MISATAFASAIVILLAVPGPTNSLLFLSGAERGFRQSLKLLVGEAAGYLSVVIPLATAAAPFFESHPAAAAALKMTAAAWIMFLAFKLWRRPAALPGTSSVSVKGIFVTTLLNPKALVIGLTIMPPGSLGDILPWVGFFLSMLAAIALCWIAAGAVAVKAASTRFNPTRVLSRLAAALLLGFSALMATSAVTVLARI